MSGLTGNWIRPYQLSPMPRVRLACFVHAGGSASFFRMWADGLPKDMDLLAVQYPGREDRFNEPRYTQMNPLAQGAARALIDYADAPLALFGHSLGAALAYEVACQLAQVGVPLRHLFVSAHPAPHLQRGGALHLGSEHDLLEDIRNQGHAHCALLDDVEMRSLFLPIVRDDYQVIETYQKTRTLPLDCAVDVLVGDADSQVTGSEAQGWQDASMRPLTLQRFPGGHFYLLEQRREVVNHLLRRMGLQRTSQERKPA